MSDTYELDDIEVTASLMEKIKGHVEHLKELQWNMMQAQEAAKKAEDAYLDYSRKVVPDLFKMNGLDSLSMDDGTVVRVVTKTNCSINKNDKDRTNVANWLRKHNGADYVKSECIVPVSQVDKMKQAGITYEEQTTMNTNAVKAFLLDQLGQKGTPAVITTADLPKGLNFFQFDEMEVVHK